MLIPLLHSRPARAVALASTSVLALGAVTAPTQAAGERTSIAAAPVITAHLGKHITLSDSNVRAGQITFRVVTAKGAHELQLARLRNGYTLQQAGADINKAFSGDAAAVRRVDHGVDFRGGAETHPNRPGEFTVSLARGHYLVLDQDGPGLAMLTVRGTTVKRRAPHANSRIGVFTYGFDTTRSLPRSGRTLIHNSSDQPHMVVFQRIKNGTTRAQVKKTFSSMSEAKPSWAMGANTSSGVISPNRSERFKYSLPAGKYVLACFWPDVKTGMPHAYMGMWRIVTLK
jgi:hypothetical protein